MNGGPEVERIDDAGDPRVADYRDLRDPLLRRRQGLFIAESRAVVAQLLASRRFRTRSVLLTPPALKALGGALESIGPGVRVFVMRHEVIRTVAGFDFHRGCLAVGERGAELPVDDLIEPGPRLLLALDELTNPDNVGGIFRNAMAFGVDGVLLSAGCADPLYRKTIRVSVGGALRVPFTRPDDWPSALARLRATGHVILALTPRAEATDLARLGGDGRAATRPLGDRLALVLGSEGTGLREETQAIADLEVKITMAAGVDSLNVATAAGIALHHLRRRQDARDS
jgi:tRNA G18 (ribose-2'-O)-methylase SpoU